MGIFKFFSHKFFITLFAPIYFSLSGIFSLILLPLYKTSLSKKTANIWMFATFIFIKLLFVKNVRLHYNPKILNFDKILFLSNHVNNLDWFFIWLSLNNLKKRNIFFNAKKNLFLYGNIMKKFSGNNTDFVFLKRNLNHDYITLVDSCNQLKKLREYVDVLFPEGTLFHKKSTTLLNIKRSKNRNLEYTPKHVLIPKTKGFEIIIQQLGNNLDGLVNCTLRYSKDISLINFIKGKKTFIDIYMDVAEIPHEDYSGFLLNLFKEKDRLIDTKNLHDEKYLTINISVPRRYKYSLGLAIPLILKKIKESWKKRRN